METILFLIGGFILLIVGAEALVRGASRLASAAGISQLVIGLTVVAFGTSAPELAVSIQSSLSGQPDIALGNVVGSNIFNVLFILGISAMITPLVVSVQLIRLDVPLMIGVTLLLWLMGMNGIIEQWEGALLFTGMLTYTVALIVISRRDPKLSKDAAGDEEDAPPKQRWWINVLLVVVGLAMLVQGSSWLVDSAVILARYFGLSELVIGLTIVAAGTSLPEVVTSIIASIHGEKDIAVGNVVGSNIFNILSVLGITAAISTDGVAVSAAASNFDIPVMVAVALACLPIFFTGQAITRGEGGLFFAYYIAYTAYLILFATQHDMLPFFSNTMLFFVIPITVIMLGITFIQQWRSNRQQR